MRVAAKRLIQADAVINRSSLIGAEVLSQEAHHLAAGGALFVRIDCALDPWDVSPCV